MAIEDRVNPDTGERFRFNEQQRRWESVGTVSLAPQTQQITPQATGQEAFLVGAGSTLSNAVSGAGRLLGFGLDEQNAEFERQAIDRLAEQQPVGTLAGQVAPFLASAGLSGGALTQAGIGALQSGTQLAATPGEQFRAGGIDALISAAPGAIGPGGRIISQVIRGVDGAAQTVQAGVRARSANRARFAKVPQAEVPAIRAAVAEGVIDNPQTLDAIDALDDVGGIGSFADDVGGAGQSTGIPGSANTGLQGSAGAQEVDAAFQQRLRAASHDYLQSQGYTMLNGQRTNNAFAQMFNESIKSHPVTADVIRTIDNNNKLVSNRAFTNALSDPAAGVRAQSVVTPEFLGAAERAANDKFKIVEALPGNGVNFSAAQISEMQQLGKGLERFKVEGAGKQKIQALISDLGNRVEGGSLKGDLWNDFRSKLSNQLKNADDLSFQERQASIRALEIFDDALRGTDAALADSLKDANIKLQLIRFTERVGMLDKFDNVNMTRMNNMMRKAFRQELQRGRGQRFSASPEVERLARIAKAHGIMGPIIGDSGTASRQAISNLFKPDGFLSASALRAARKPLSRLVVAPPNSKLDDLTDDELTNSLLDDVLSLRGLSNAQ